jgi:uncharacterized repeat protein (TIGR03803 family)
MAQGMGSPNLGNGDIFAFDVESNAYTVLHTFGGGADGQNPMGSLVQSGHMLYGMTWAGGTHGDGTIFSFDLNSNTRKTLHDFTGWPSTDGIYPFGSLILSGSTLYGVTSLGGATDDGTVFSLNLDSSTYTTLHSFSDAGGGYHPMADLLLSGDTLYGLAEKGGAYGGGVIFSLTVPEPATLGLLALGGAAMIRRKRKC